MHDTLKPALDALLQRHDLSDSVCRDSIGAIMDGHCDPVDIAAFLTAMAVSTMMMGPDPLSSPMDLLAVTFASWVWSKAS